MKKILRYINDTLNFGVLVKVGVPLPLEGYYDADWDNDTNDRRLVFVGFLVVLLFLGVPRSRPWYLALNLSFEVELMRLSTLYGLNLCYRVT